MHLQSFKQIRGEVRALRAPELAELFSSNTRKKICTCLHGNSKAAITNSRLLTLPLPRTSAGPLREQLAKVMRCNYVELSL